MKAIKSGFWVLLFIGLVSLCVSFATQNNDLMTLNFFNHTSEAYAKWLVVLSAAAIGAIISAILLIVELIVLESKNIVLRRVNRKLERALQKYTAIDPLEAKSIEIKTLRDDFVDSDV